MYCDGRARVAELVDAGDSKSPDLGCASSSLASGTNRLGNERFERPMRDCPCFAPGSDGGCVRMKIQRVLRIGHVFAAAFIFSGISNTCQAEALVAVATNFFEAANALKEKFEDKTGHEVTLISGSTGRLYAMIVNGAPFDVFLAADSERPEKLESKGMTVPNSRFTYAAGRLALWGPGLQLGMAGGSPSIEELDFRRLTVPNPELAPYGYAALAVIENLGIEDGVGGRIVYPESVGQSFAFVATGNADIGFVALSHLLTSNRDEIEDYWIIPESFHPPISQDAVRMIRSVGNDAAAAFHEFLGSPDAERIMLQFGYSVPR